MTEDKPLILHATAVAVQGRGLIIRGASGSGKSGLALQLMAFGAQLVADDRVTVAATPDGLLLGVHDTIWGLIEARGIGLLQADVADGAIAAAVVDLDLTEKHRLPPQRSIEILGRSIPLLHKADSPHFPAALVQYLRGGRKETDT